MDRQVLMLPLRIAREIKEGAKRFLACEERIRRHEVDEDWEMNNSQEVQP